MKTVGERYSYFYNRVSELEMRLYLAEQAMCPECKKIYAEAVKYVKAAE